MRGERLSALGEFVSGVAHEINNPLQSVIGTLELVLDQPHYLAIWVDLERTRFEAGRAGRIVRNLLTFVKRWTDERLLEDLNDIVKSTAKCTGLRARDGGHRDARRYVLLLPLVLANREEIQQAILHLIINAQQAMAAGAGPARALDPDVPDRRRCGPGGPRYGPRRPCRRGGAHLRAVLHHQDDGWRVGARAVAVARDRERASRLALFPASRIGQLLPPHAAGRRLPGTGVYSLAPARPCSSFVRSVRLPTSAPIVVRGATAGRQPDRNGPPKGGHYVHFRMGPRWSCHSCAHAIASSRGCRVGSIVRSNRRLLSNTSLRKNCASTP